MLLDCPFSVPPNLTALCTKPVAWQTVPETTSRYLRPWLLKKRRPSLLWTKNPSGKPCVLGDNLLGSLLVEQEYVGTVKVTWVRIHGRAGKGIHQNRNYLNHSKLQGRSQRLGTENGLKFCCFCRLCHLSSDPDPPRPNQVTQQNNS